MKHHFIKLALLVSGFSLLLQGMQFYAAEAALPKVEEERTEVEAVPEHIAKFKDEVRAHFIEGATKFPEAKPAYPIKKDPNRLGVDITAAAAVVMDEETGRILFAKNSENERPIASITKLMSALVLFDIKTKWDDVVVLDELDRQALGRYYLEPGDRISKMALLQLALTASANNAVAALVRTSGLTEEQFVQKMNERARSMGIQAHFAEPIGLSSKNTANAVAVAHILYEALRYDAIYRATVNQEFKVTRPGGTQYVARSTNELLDTFLNQKPYEITGGKTGYIEEAGFCLAQRIKKNGHELLVVVLGAKEHALRFQEVKALTVWAFDAYTWGDEVEKKAE